MKLGIVYGSVSYMRSPARRSKIAAKGIAAPDTLFKILFNWSPETRGYHIMAMKGVPTDSLIFYLCLVGDLLACPSSCGYKGHSASRFTREFPRATISFAHYVCTFTCRKFLGAPEANEPKQAGYSAWAA